MLLPKQDIIKKKRVDENVKYINFDINNNKNGKYKIKLIQNSKIYKEKLESSYQPELYYLMS